MTELKPTLPGWFITAWVTLSATASLFSIYLIVDLVVEIFD